MSLSNKNIKISTRIHRIFGLFFVFFSFQNLYATDPLVLDEKQKTVSVSNSCQLLKGNFDETTILNQIKDFKPYNFQDLTIGMEAENIHWFRFSVKNQTNQDLILKIIRSKYGKIYVYQFEENQLKLIHTGGTESEYADKIIKSNHDIFPLNINQNEQKTYFLKINRFERKSFWAEISTEHAFISQTHRNDLLEGIILGGLLIVTIFQFLVYFITHEKDYLRLSFYLLSLSVLSFMISGHLFEFMPNSQNHLRLYFMALPATTFFSYFFAFHFLGIQKNQSKFIWYSGIFILIFTAICFVAALFQNFPLAHQINIASFLSSILFIYTGFKRRKDGFKPANNFLIAYIPTTLTIVLFLLFTQGFLGYSWFLQNSLIISFCIHAILFSVAVAQKIKTYKDEADASMLAQKENLELKVRQRTQDLAIEKEKIQEKSDELKMVMKELHHRVKNNLTIVSSLLELQGNRLNDEVSAKAFQEGQQRIEAMSLIHQRLYKSEQLTTINMSDYITELTSNLIHAYGHTRENLYLKIEVDYEELDIDNAIPIGLILNELLTNVLKYAFKDIEKPTLSIRLLKENGILLEVKDNGKGIDLEKWHKPSGSFGKRLIYGLTEQIGGEIELKNDNGACFSLRIPENFLK